MYKSLEECVLDLEQQGELVRIREEVDPYLEMAAIHRRVYQEGGPAILFENVKGTKYRAVSNLFGTPERSKYMFRKTWDGVHDVIAMRDDPMSALKNPLKNAGTGFSAMKALPMRLTSVNASKLEEINISDLPMIQSWPDDGGAFITLPQVLTEDPDNPGLMNANLGMYRAQLNGNDYVQDKEIGMHYQIHRGIGVHQTKAVQKGEPLKVSIFIGGPPAHTLAAVMPLPEGLSEMLFAGLLSGRRFRHSYEDGYVISHDADFVITGEVYPEDTKPEGPFGDHLGYYSLKHEFPVLHVHKVYGKPDAIYPFTVVGRPPQEDTSFGEIIHELTGNAVTQELPGVKEVHAIDAAGVHPLLFAIGSERYTPFEKVKKPMELLTIANRILGFGQLSLAKYLWITADDESLNTHDELGFMQYILERIDLRRDLHFQTNTTIDTLDYSGTGLNTGSKVVMAAYGEKKRYLCQEIPAGLDNVKEACNPQFVLPGVVAVELNAYQDETSATDEINAVAAAISKNSDMSACPLIVVCDDSDFVSKTKDNFLWTTFTRSNPSHDMHGINSFIENKHWGCDTLIIDARIKPHHAPPLIEDEEVEAKIERFFENGRFVGDQ
ncbi:UbiD family decarboxylase [Salicibibacter cibarius]|uniref:UbiD family decarboxylase n=1 Tax=Salicibibacter cibarius TaxID=2743000 RepID=A0A7T7CAW4_9BACI|nr:UbiD family decarboxylase [Salicibibacter cibarius]QQK75329.1 UbiD family decarboxylase [Salicibibacter cibarius]